jgi:hypothetical protein
VCVCVYVCVCVTCIQVCMHAVGNVSESSSPNTSIPYTATAKDLVCAKIKIKSRETKPVHDVRGVEVLEPAKDLVGEIPHVVV